MDGGLHPFIAFTYFSAHPLNDTHSHTMTSSPFLSIFLKLSSSIPLFLRSSHNWLHFIPSCTLPSSILCTPFFFLLPTFTVFHALVSPYLCICCFFHIQYRYPVPVLSIHTKEDQVRHRSDSIKRMSGLTVHTSAARRGYVGVLLFLA